jgi:hypothetical protein
MGPWAEAVPKFPEFDLDARENQDGADSQILTRIIAVMHRNVPRESARW